MHEVEGPLAHFGPDLGGERTRTAVAGLLRVHPLQYTAGAAAGSRGALAAAKEVGPGDREALTALVTRVLGREPAATTATLARLREEAARDLAFERAARIERDRSALRWLTRPQRAAALDPVDVVVAGGPTGGSCASS